jgi:hypothetical protein
MASTEIDDIKRIFTSRLEALDHILDVGEKHFGNLDSVIDKRLAPDMHPFGTQIAITCNQPRGFAQWCAGQSIDNLPPEVESAEKARSHIRQTKELVAGISVDDSKMDEIKHVGLGPERFCEVPARVYVNDFLMPNFYFHITAAYAILRYLGAPIGKADYLTYLAPYVQRVEKAD